MSRNAGRMGDDSAANWETKHPAPSDAKARRAGKSVVCYNVESLPTYNALFYQTVREESVRAVKLEVPPREARCFTVPAGSFFRISCLHGSQVGDLNLWQRDNLGERFFSGKTRQLHATHLTTGDRLWSSMPYLRPIATITDDSLQWYGWDDDGAGVHDVIGTRCDPYTHFHLHGESYHHCCHSNLTRALAEKLGVSQKDAEHHVHDVLNVFMCTGFTKDTHQYFMKASPARKGDYIEFFAETDLLGALSTCPGGDCSSTHSSDEATCYPLTVEVFTAPAESLKKWKPFQPSEYCSD
ncbi:urea carboxylase-associated family protein [Grimontia sp. NTOU-MAR1]|uniref:urea carboxylase-associated family protein n=1 Tax=Grimontia sp. NTOU-MAR1 TaxID=3111011 RepID=UPI002DBD730C|nr:DUF1989 domain-containing protein [Grimontia sp. NTOU-MAR1]WRV98378.1 DUF1989 domain-containing protein [Grimontia sp. NTOU-MAR1]